ncbi:MAG: hypothetical protein Q9M91_03935 [Candidatus Dojkabacteria bacterium]|nr:hypothetical protein [Candidatus Dojkabacteria bacterium]MDQ7020963.1 hypothetical protein [Candidatus Dojkabacteria bacterium]
MRNFIDLHKKYLGTGIYNDTNDYRDILDPIPRGQKWTIVNEIGNKLSSFRDTYILEYIQAKLQEYDKVFIIFGASHAVMQEKAVRSIMKQNE